MNEKVKTILTEFRRGLETIYGERLLKVVLFGSQARGDAAPDSDIDVLVVLEGQVLPGQEIRRTGGLASRLGLEHDVALGLVFLSEEEFVHRDFGLVRNVQREGVAV